jgi:hypothetical protein
MRKKPKLKPSSEALKVLNFMTTDANSSVKELVEKTGLSKQQVYSARHYIKKRGLLGKAKALPMTGIAPKVKQADTVSSALVKKSIVKLNQEIEIRDQQISALQSELNRIRHLYMDQLAVVRYLEIKLMQFVEANTKGN